MLSDHRINGNIYSDMEVGDLVLCHCTYEKYQDHFDFEVQAPAPGKVYTIRKVIVLGTFRGILLEEIINEQVDTLEFGPMELQFDSECFSVVQPADLSEIKQLLKQ